MTDGETGSGDGVSSPAAATRPRRSSALAREIVQTLALTLVVFLVVQNFIAQPFQVKQSSMERTFVEGQYVLIDRLTHLWSPYARGQVVVFQPPEGWASVPKVPFIKRVIGEPGDTIDIRDGDVLVNDVALHEPYLYRDEAGGMQPTEATGGQTHWVVPQGDLFVMGDHRQVSEDSRLFGPIPVSSVIGRGILRYWPFASFGIIQAPSYGL